MKVRDCFWVRQERGFFLHLGSCRALKGPYAEPQATQTWGIPVSTEEIFNQGRRSQTGICTACVPALSPFCTRDQT